MRLRLGRVLACTALLCTVAACGPGSDHSDASAPASPEPTSAAPSSATHPSAPSASSTPSPAGDLCAAIDAIDVTPLIGNAHPSPPCGPDDVTGAEAVQVWVSDTENRRVTVSVVDNTNPLLSFNAVVGKQKVTATGVLGTPQRTFDLLRKDSLIAFDMGSTWLSVFESEVNGPAYLPADARTADAIRAFAVNVAAPAIYR